MTIWHIKVILKLFRLALVYPTTSFTDIFIKNTHLVILPLTTLRSPKHKSYHEAKGAYPKKSFYFSGIN